MLGTRLAALISRSVLAGTALALALAPPVAAQTPVTTCGQELAGPATLPADLDCTGHTGNAVTLHGGTFTLEGHTITGGLVGVYCSGPCKIIGPGTVTASSGIGVLSFGRTLRMKEVDVTNHPIMGVEPWQSATILGPATISGNAIGVRNGGKVTLRDVTMTGNGRAVEAANGAATARAYVFDSTITGNGAGILADRIVKVVDSTVTGNGTFGIRVSGGSSCDHKATASIKRSTVTGNDTDAGCGTTEVCADVATCQAPPRLAGGAVCDHSYRVGSGNPGEDWDVCTLD
jgi:hypothetical protein